MFCQGSIELPDSSSFKCGDCWVFCGSGAIWPYQMAPSPAFIQKLLRLQQELAAPANET